MTVTLDELEQRHLNSFCTDPDCWCHDEDYWKMRLEAKEL